jgi:hypothetical protein
VNFYCGAVDIGELKTIIKYAMLKGIVLYLEQEGQKYNIPNNFFDDINNVKIVGRNNTFNGVTAKELKDKNITLEGIIIE